MAEIVAMTHEQAEQESARLAREHPERDSYVWSAREAPDGEWEVVRVRLPHARRRETLQPEQEKRPEPPYAEDTRTIEQKLGTWWGTG